MKEHAVNRIDTQWIWCPQCHGKTRTQICMDTVLENFPLFCPKCKQTYLVSARNGRTKYISGVIHNQTGQCVS